MENKKSMVKDIKNEILSYDCNYDYLYHLLEKNFEVAISGILNSTLYLFKNIDNIHNKDTIDNLIILLNNYIRKNKDKKTFDILYKKIAIFLENLPKSLDYLRLIKLESYISKLIDIQNKCLSLPLKKKKSDRYYFITYIIFELRDIRLLFRYILDNTNELVKNNSILKAVFIEVIEKFIQIDEDNTIEIKYYNQVINIFLKGKIYKKLFDGQDNEFMKILKSSNKSFVQELVGKVEDDLFITKEALAKEYSVSIIFPKDLETFTYTPNGEVDFTSQSIITIDEENGQCLDDALYAEKNSDGTYTLYIHLTNPPSIIPYESNTMLEALKRTESIYLEDFTIPIYKEELSNYLLSILPRKRTNTMTFIIDIDTDFSVLLDTIKVVKGVVINRHKLSYEKVDELLKYSQGDELSQRLLLLSQICNKLSRDQLQIRAYHKLENLITGKTSTNSAKADLSKAHMMVENSMIFSNRLPDILDRYHHLGLIFPYRVQEEAEDSFITSFLSNIDNIDPNNQTFRNIAKSYMLKSKYSPVNTGHCGLGVAGYVRVSSSARRALDAVALYILNDLYINRDKGDLDAKYYFWEREIKYWCEFANNKIAENNNFANQYNYLHSKGRILERK